MKFLLSLLVAATTLSSLCADPLASWSRLTPAPQGQNLDNIVSGNGLFVAAGRDAVVTSEDGLNWNWHAIEGDHRDISFGNGRFVTAGTGIQTSTDGVNWSRPAGGNFFGCAFGNNTFVAVGDGILTSTDGIHWERQSSPDRLLAVTFGHSEFIAVGFDGRILRSPDGRTWSSVGPGGGAMLRGVAYGNGRYLATGLIYAGNTSDGIVYSSDDGGLTWKTIPGPQQLPSGRVQFEGGLFLSAWRSMLLSSTDGRTWTPRGPAIDAGIGGIRHDYGLFVAVGAQGKIGVSEDLITWTQLDFPAAPPLFATAFGNGRWVAVGGAGSMMGASGDDSWEAISSGVTTDLFDLVYAEGRFVAVGQEGVILLSADGIEWSEQNSKTDAHLSGICFYNGIFVAVGNDGTILVSEDAVQWELRPSSTEQSLMAIVGGKGILVAVGSGGTVVTSEDAHTWVPSTFLTVSWQTITYGAGRFVMAGPGGRFSAVASSEDADTWILDDSSFWNAKEIRDVEYHHGRFVAAGSPLGTVFTSTDGQKWRRQPYVSTALTLHGTGFGGNRFVVVGGVGQAFHSHPLKPHTSLRLREDRSVTLNVFGRAGARYEIQTSEDLINWETVESGVQTDADLEWQEPADGPRKFYRVNLK